MENHVEAKLDVALFLHELERNVSLLLSIYETMSTIVPLEHKLGSCDRDFWDRVDRAVQGMPGNSPEEWAAMSTWLRCVTVGLDSVLRMAKKQPSEVKSPSYYRWTETRQALEKSFPR